MRFMAFNKNYFLLTVFLFAVEIGIALFVHDTVIRPYIGDVIVVILIYCFVKSFFDFPILPTALGVLLFAFGVETLQYLNFIVFLGLEKSKLANTVIGNSFAWMDMLTYVIGVLIVIIAEKCFTPRIEIL
jgi:hypothetical protein